MVDDCTIMQKTPEADLLYGFDWKDWLPTGVTITGSTWTIEGGITKTDEDSDDTTTTIKLSGGSLGVCYECLNEINMSNLEKDSRTLHVMVVAKCK